MPSSSAAPSGDRPSLGLVLSVPPGDPRGEALLAVAREACADGHEVLLYLLHEGVRHLGRSELGPLADAGAKLYCCAMGAQKRDIAQDGRAVFSGLYVLASLVAGCDRFLSA